MAELNNKPVSAIEYLCSRCKEPIKSGAKACTKCGAPTNRFSGLCHAHRSLITAIGSFFAAVGVDVLIYNLIISSKTLENQQRLFIEDFKPRFRLEHKLPERVGADSIRFDLIFFNTGKTDATKAREEVTLTTFPDSVTHTKVFKQDILPKGQPFTNKCNFPVVYGNLFTIRYFATYKWVGEQEEQQFEYYYVALFDKNTDRYSFNVIDKAMVVGLWHLRNILDSPAK